MNILIRMAAVACIVHISAAAGTQTEQPAPVTWRYNLVATSAHEAVLYVEARIAPGWHIYSQHLQPGGPVPTKFTFQAQNAYKCVGVPQEQGNAIQYYDKLYEMDITWYAQKVSFIQKFLFSEAAVPIKGIVEYMVCNDHICIPVEQEFSVERERLDEK